MTDGRSTPQDLLDFLRARLPEYLVPATMTVLDRLPPGASGKLDRDALPSPRPVSPTPGGAGSVAEMVAWTWASTLPTGQAEADDDFFAVGGNSLPAVQLVLRPQTLAGTGLYPGDLLCVWVASANRDEEVFTEPDTFRIDCDPNPHLAFTAGKHFCLGASLSRLELRLVFESLLTRVESIHLFGFPIRKPTNLPRIRKRPGRTTGWLIQAKGWLIQLRPTGRDELTE